MFEDNSHRKNARVTKHSQTQKKSKKGRQRKRTTVSPKAMGETERNRMC